MLMRKRLEISSSERFLSTRACLILSPIVLISPPSTATIHIVARSLLVIKKLLQRQIKARERKADDVVKAAVDAFREDCTEILDAVRAGFVLSSAGFDIRIDFPRRQTAKSDGGEFDAGHHTL